MEFKKINLVKSDGICLMTLSSPENLNALSSDMLAELHQAMLTITQDDEINVVILTGSGKAFVAGADIVFMKDLTPAEAVEYSKKTTDIYKIMENSKKIFIAAINGFALGGGCELTLACDLRIASTKAKLGLPETTLGIIPGGGGTQKLARMIGAGKAKELIFTGELLSAAAALSLGLINMVVEPENLIGESYNMAHKIQKNSMTANGYAKESINKGTEIDLESAITLEKNLFGLCFATEDQKEGMTAFIEKRPVVFNIK